MNDSTPILCPAPGIQVLDRVDGCYGIDTLEGRFGPLLLGAQAQAHFLDLLPRSYTPEHAHATESIIYTVRGRWVLASQGTRTLIQAGSLFWFGPDVATGYELPFDEPALLLIFKTQRSASADAFITYLRDELKPKLEAAREEGEAFLMADLPADHAAICFARELASQGVSGVVC
jgi:quercetin dioxygenase-like cupin family protein